MEISKWPQLHMLSKAENEKKKTHADISMKLSKNVHEHE